MGMFINFIFLFLFNKFTVSEKSKNNIYHSKNAENDQMQLLETTTDLSFEYNDSLPTELPSSYNYDCENNTCIIKCCPQDQLLNQEHDCENISLHDAHNWKALNVKNYTSIIRTFIEVVELNANEENKSISCPFFNGEEFRLNNDGTVYSDVLEKNITQKSYCIDNLLKDGIIKEVAVICYEEVWDDDDDDDDYSQYEYVTEYLKRTAIAISVFFLFILVLAYIFTPHKLDLQKRCTFACCGNLFLTFLILFISKTVSTYVGGDDGHKCLTLAILLQYSFLAFYFWLNINCYEIFRIIRGTFNFKRIGDLSQSHGRFHMYLIICHGCPLVICSLTIAMQIIPLSKFPSSIRSYIIKPGINEGYCWFNDIGAQIAYFYVIEISLHILNAFFMGYTSYLVYQEKLTATFCKRRTSNVELRTNSATNHLDTFKQQMRIYLLYIAIWIMNIVTLIHSEELFWRVVDIFVSLQGAYVTIFILYTSRASLVIPIYENLSRSFEVFSSVIREQKSNNSSATETSEISLKSFEQKSTDSIATETSEISLKSLELEDESRENMAYIDIE
ncbi:UNVERIFIED_CONTAM: hypothetical protein RMT77_008807 [Armadillidium vulgare]